MNNSKKILIFFKNYLSTISFIYIAYLFYFNNSFYLSLDNLNNKGFLYSKLQFSFNNFNLETTKIFTFVFIAYIILLIPFYIFYNNKSKALIILEYLIKKIKNFNYKINHLEKTAILAWLVKFFFAPLMIFWLSGHIFNLINNLYLSYSDISLIKINFLDFFNRHLFWLCFTAILFFDVFFFTLGYLIEIPFLKNKIKSVEPTLLGWFVALICYPPFNSYITDLGWINNILNYIIPGSNTNYLSNIIGWYSTEFPKFNTPIVHITFNSLIIILMGIYSWASISLGFKASNLTNRGIIKKGPYRFVRHPAYITKNLSWWIGAFPFIFLAFQKGNYRLVGLAIFSLISWTFIYFMRAWTEERHLSKDKDYLEYKKKVKYRFIPGIY